MRRSTWFRGLLALVLFAGALAPVALRWVRPAAAAVAPVARLTVGKGAFWEGTVHRRNSNGERAYAISVAPGGHQLRVAFDHPDYRVFFSLDVRDPDGRVAASGGGYNSSELVVSKPRAGVWTAVVTVGDGSYGEFRLRAILDRAPRRPPAKPVTLLPNLQLIPPYEFTFKGSLGSLAYGTSATGSCTPDDTVEYQGVRCLRFSVGPANVGAGPLELRFEAMQGLVAPGTAYQRLYRSDGSFSEREAGTFEYHKTHTHYHHTGFGSLELYKVTDRKRGTMTKAGRGPKQGFCTADVMIANWWSFANAGQDSAHSECVSQNANGRNNPTGTMMAISPGWADLYSWEQDGNYVDFGNNTDGYYVVRSTADASGYVRESNENDNTSYAYIQVTGNSVRVLERGRGQSPWDARKVLARDGLNLTA